MKRLFDTFRLLVDISTSDTALLPGGIGWRASLRVRFLHGRVRRRLLRRGKRLEAERGKGDATPFLGDATPSREWDCEAYGVPINQEDQMATLCAFSYNVRACAKRP